MKCVTTTFSWWFNKVEKHIEQMINSLKYWELSFPCITRVLAIIANIIYAIIKLKSLINGQFSNRIMIYYVFRYYKLPNNNLSIFNWLFKLIKVTAIINKNTIQFISHWVNVINNIYLTTWSPDNYWVYSLFYDKS